MGRISGTLGLVVLLTCLAPRLALAAEVTEEDANAMALAGHYQEALEAYSTLYSRTWEPTYLHNVARCYQKLGRPDEAIDYFNRYLRLAKDLDESVKEEVRGYIREMETLRRDREAKAAQSKGAPTSPVLGGSSPAIAAEAKLAPLVGSSNQPLAGMTADSRSALGTPSPGQSWWSARKWYFWVPAVGTVVFATSAIVAGLSANARYSDLQNSCGSSCSDSQVDSLKSRAHLTDVLWVLAGVSAVATGVSFYVDSREASVSITWRF